MSDTTDRSSPDVEDAADAALVQLIEQRVDDQTALLKHCLQALRFAGIPLSCQTGAVLQELGARLHQAIHEAMEEDEDPTGHP